MITVCFISIVDIFRIVGSLFASVLLSGGVITLVVKFAADWISKRTLDHYNNKNAKELEQIKSNYLESLSRLNHELDRAKRRHFLYSQSQFDLYNSLWKQLVYTKRLADELWKKADPQKLPSFADQIVQTKYVIEENLLLIEEEHYNDLMALIYEFENFMVGKQRLVEIRQSSIDAVLANIQDVTEMINKNSSSKERYDALVTQIGDTFRKQIHE